MFKSNTAPISRIRRFWDFVHNDISIWWLISFSKVRIWYPEIRFCTKIWFVPSPLHLITAHHLNAFLNSRGICREGHKFYAGSRINFRATIPEFFYQWVRQNREYEFRFTDIWSTFLCFWGADSFIPHLPELERLTEIFFWSFFSGREDSWGLCA